MPSSLLTLGGLLLLSLLLLLTGILLYNNNKSWNVQFVYILPQYDIYAMGFFQKVFG